MYLLKQLRAKIFCQSIYKQYISYLGKTLKTMLTLTISSRKNNKCLMYYHLKIVNTQSPHKKSCEQELITKESIAMDTISILCF